jgi:hypothetical protein
MSLLQQQLQEMNVKYNEEVNKNSKQRQNNRAVEASNVA